MINKIQNINNVIANNKIPKKNHASYKINNNTQLKTDSFHRNISFKGVKLPSGEYEQEEIAFAKEKLNEKDDKWKLDLYREIYSSLKLNRPLREFTARNGQRGTCDMNNPIERFILGVMSLGLNEIDVQLENLGFRNEAKDQVRKMDILRADLQNIKLKEEVAEMKKAEQYAEHKVNYLKEMNEVKEKQLKPKLLDLVQRQREGRPSDMPNCIMLSNKNNNINEELIKWTADNVNGKFVTIKNGDGIVSYLEQAEEDYQQTGDWNLMYIKDMDKLIDHNEVADDMVEYMKDIMSAAAEDYHTTIIFSSTHPESLDKIALQPHRVKKIATDKVISPDELYIEDAKNRVKDIQNAKKTPMSTINDLLIISGASKDLKLVWEHTPEQFKEAEAIITRRFDKVKDSQYVQIFNESVKHLV